MLQARVRGKRLRDKFVARKKFLKENEAKIVLLQNIIRGMPANCCQLSVFLKAAMISWLVDWEPLVCFAGAFARRAHQQRMAHLAKNIDSIIKVCLENYCQTNGCEYLRF